MNQYKKKCFYINEAKANELKSITISNCGFSKLTFNVLKRHGLITIYDLAILSPSYIRHMRNCGKKSWDEILSYLESIGIEYLPICVETNSNKDEIADYLNGNDFSETVLTLKNTQIEECNFGVRTYKRCKIAGINTAYDLFMFPIDKLVMINGFGKNCLEEIKSYFLSIGLMYPEGAAIIINSSKKVGELPLSPATIELLAKNDIVELKDLKKLAQIEYRNIFEKVNENDRNELIFRFYDLDFPIYNDASFDSYLKYVIDHSILKLQDVDILTFSLIYGLNGNTKRPIDVIATTTGISNEEMVERTHILFNKILVIINDQRLKKITDYLKGKTEDFMVTNEYRNIFKSLLEYKKLCSE